MDNMWWSWILTVVGLTGFILAGRKVWWCWYINIGCQILWFTYAIVTEQYGFIVASLAYTWVFTQNAIKWTREHRDPIGEHLKKMDYNEIAFPPPYEIGGAKIVGMTPSDQFVPPVMNLDGPPENVHSTIESTDLNVSDFCGWDHPHEPHKVISPYPRWAMNCQGKS